MSNKTTSDEFSADWKPIWTIKSRKKKKKNRPQTPHDFQEIHNPTHTVDVKVTHVRKLQRSRRRIVDSRLWEAMSDFQQNAALEIDFSYTLITKGLGYRSSDPSRMRYGKSHRPETERDTTLMSLYFSWAEHCQKTKCAHASCLDILVFGKSCRTVDRERQSRNGWAKENLLQCLSTYCELKGWPTE